MCNTFYTLIYKTVDCPMWKDKIRITAKYRFVDESNPYKARFTCATCEVLENIKLPEYKKDKRLGLYRFCRLVNECSCLQDFPEEIDVRN